MKKKSIVISSLLALSLLIVGSFITFQPKEVSIKETASYGKGYTLSLSGEWTHPEQISTNETPFGNFNLSEVYMNSNKCFILQDVYNFREDLSVTTDYDLTYKMAFSKGVTVLKNVVAEDLINIKVENQEPIQFLKSPLSDYSYFIFDSDKYNYSAVVRGFSKDKFAVILRAGCLKTSDIDPVTLFDEITLKNRS